MRIDLNGGMTIPETSTEKTEASRSAAAEKGRQAPESQFSASDASVNILLANALAAPEVRMGKVEEIRAQMSAGTYQVSASQLATVLLEHMRTRT